ncbi:MAG TPA: cobalt ECF transporter T component CbiQ [Acidobacteriota bacterium]|nr:cobalt ECF transporter T component CbiQ [Acidobacteriota bacterium]HRR25161.1 cobalt ECF transporter T component CbiQ [Acidobacteriota bacterium]HRR55659.1 cobalt ECF transporter T component CbiQ [Acidobacteriota bacterium]HRV08273.1 cobalt ECF transporter T component CbiQ [Acidobacteriota bacterium]
MRGTARVRPGLPLHPRTLWIFALCYIVAANLAGGSSWWGLVGLSFLLVVVGWMLSISWRKVLRGMWIPTPFLAAGVAMVFTTPGDVWFVVPGVDLPVTVQGGWKYLEIAWKVYLCWTVAAVVFQSRRPEEILQGLAALRVPAALVGILAVMLRYLEVLVGEGRRTLRAKTARTGRARLGFRRLSRDAWLFRVYGALVGNLFLRALARAQRVHLAMLARGYDGRLLPSPGEGRMTEQDWGMVSLAVLLPLIILLGGGR